MGLFWNDENAINIYFEQVSWGLEVGRYIFFDSEKLPLFCRTFNWAGLRRWTLCNFRTKSSSKNRTFAGELTWVVSIYYIIFLIALDFIDVSNLFSLLDLVPESNFMPFLSNFYSISSAISSKIKVFSSFIIRQRILVVLRIHWILLSTHRCNII